MVATQRTAAHSQPRQEAVAGGAPPPLHAARWPPTWAGCGLRRSWRPATRRADLVQLRTLKKSGEPDPPDDHRAGTPSREGGFRGDSGGFLSPPRSRARSPRRSAGAGPRSTATGACTTAPTSTPRAAPPERAANAGTCDLRTVSPTSTATGSTSTSGKVNGKNMTVIFAVVVDHRHVLAVDLAEVEVEPVAVTGLPLRRSPSARVGGALGGAARGVEVGAVVQAPVAVDGVAAPAEHRGGRAGTGRASGNRRSRRGSHPSTACPLDDHPADPFLLTASACAVGPGRPCARAPRSAQPASGDVGGHLAACSGGGALQRLLLDEVGAARPGGHPPASPSRASPPRRPCGREPA